MKSLLWKEIRENARWTILALVVLCLASFYALDRGTQDYYSNITLCTSTFLIVTAFGFPLVGAALGCLQILPELKRDQWAALLHRPLPRWQLLSAKVSVGLLFYALATLVPLAACVVYVSTPGTFAAPFVPKLTLPALSDWCVGLCFYALALLMALHGGRWWGTRGILAIAGAAIFALHLVPRWPFALPLAGFVVFLLAAAGALISHRVVSHRPALLRGAFVIAIFFGGYGLFAYAVAGKNALGLGNVVYSYGFTGFVIGSDGQILYAEQKPNGENVITDMAGKDVTAQFGSGGEERIANFYPTAYFMTPKQSQSIYRSFYSRNSYTFVQAVSLRSLEREAWFFLPNDRYFIGYDRLTKRSIGFCDREGFKEPGAPVVPFSETGRTVGFSRASEAIHFQSDGEIYRINFGDRTMKPFFHVGDEPVYGFSAVSGDREKDSYFSVAFLDRFVLLDREGKPLSTFPYPLDPLKWNSLSVATNATEDRIYTQWTSSRFTPGQSSLPEYVYIYDLKGQQLATYDRTAPTPPVKTDWSRLALLVISPPAILAVQQTNTTTTNLWSYGGIFPFPFMATWPEIGFLALGTLVLGVVTFVIARRQHRSMREAVLWAVFVFLLGLPGLLTFRLASGWPVRVRCPQCSTKRDLAGSTCPSCGVQWPAPEKTGSELLEPWAAR